MCWMGKLVHEVYRKLAYLGKLGSVRALWMSSYKDCKTTILIFRIQSYSIIMIVCFHFNNLKIYLKKFKNQWIPNNTIELQLHIPIHSIPNLVVFYTKEQLEGSGNNNIHYKKCNSLIATFYFAMLFLSFNQYVLDGIIKSCNKTTAGYPFKYYTQSLKWRALQLLVERRQYKYLPYVAEL